ncbi:MAG TPA: methyl-accepting chemotaxis protein [Anaeromyxobacter sp.]|nr:methyl-accepting chemotaxis protein [Anaeromyxobacter sp.]
MKRPSLSVRSKILLPPFVGLLATLVATAVIVWLVRGASLRLARVEGTDFPVLSVSQELESSLERLRLILANAAATGDPAALQAADQLHASMMSRLASAGGAAYGPVDEEAIRHQLDRYFTQSRDRAAAEGASASTPGTRRSRASWIGPEGATGLDEAYSGPFALLERHAQNAQRKMLAAFGDARSEQRLAIVVGPVILLVTALGSFGFALFFSARLSRPIRSLSEVALKVASGDLTHDVAASSGDEVGVLAQSFQRMVARLREIVGTLKSSAEQLARAAEQLSDHTRAQSAMLEQQASGVAETSSTTRELEQTSSVAATRAASVLEVAKRATAMSDAGRQSAERSAGELLRIQGSVESMVGQASYLLEQAHQVGDIVETVRDLAVQSHVLSLNASIEAAKAGEAGKSFAVVAQEVRALAEQSGQGAARIGKIVEDMLSAVQTTRDRTAADSSGISGSLDQIRASGESLREIGGIVRETSDAALQIASAVQEQSSGIAQIAVAMRDLDKGMEAAMGRIRSLELSALQVAETATRISDIAAEFNV